MDTIGIARSLGPPAATAGWSARQTRIRWSSERSMEASSQELGLRQKSVAIGLLWVGLDGAGVVDAGAGCAVRPGAPATVPTDPLGAGHGLATTMSVRMATIAIQRPTGGRRRVRATTGKVPSGSRPTSTGPNGVVAACE